MESSETGLRISRMLLSQRPILFKIILKDINSRQKLAETDEFGVKIESSTKQVMIITAMKALLKCSQFLTEKMFTLW